MALTVQEWTDPLCPWAWAAEPLLRRLRSRWPSARWSRRYAILFDDGDDPAPDPVAETAWYANHLREIAAVTGASYPHRLERVARSSWPAALAAKAAEPFGPRVADAVLYRLRATMFRTGRPPDTAERVRAALAGLPVAGLDPESARAAVRADHAAARRPCAAILRPAAGGPHPGRLKELPGGWRYPLPTLVLSGPRGRVAIGGWRCEEDYLDAASEVDARVPNHKTYPDGN